MNTDRFEFDGLVVKKSGPGWRLYLGHWEGLANDPGWALRQWRHSLRATQQEVCAASGVGERTLREIEAGRSDPKLATFASLVIALSEIERLR